MRTSRSGQRKRCVNHGAPRLVPLGHPAQLPRFVGGVDISFVKGNAVDACAGFVVLDFNTLEVRR